MASLCIIPARGGSKRIPRKNIKDFFGKPIISYSIEAAIESRLFDEIMVSTDDPEIADVAKQYGVEIPFMRSEKNSDDYATTVDVLCEVLEEYESRKRVFEYGCCIYPAAPLISVQRLNQGRTKLVEDGYDTVFPIARFDYPIWRSLKITNGRVSMFWPENLTKRSQDLQEAWHDAGQWYWFNCDRLIQSKKLWTENTFGIPLDALEAQDIDNLTDWKLAELKYALQSS